MLDLNKRAGGEEEGGSGEWRDKGGTRGEGGGGRVRRARSDISRHSYTRTHLQLGSWCSSVFRTDCGMRLDHEHCSVAPSS